MKIQSVLWTAVLLALGAAVADAQGARKGEARDLHQGVDQQKVDAAIERGKQWLLASRRHDRTEELVLYTLRHAGVDPGNEVYQSLFKSVLEAPLERTYEVSLRAMILSELDPAQYQDEIARCCQFLVDNQLEDGDWSYGAPTTYSPWVKTSTNARDVATPTKTKASAKRETTAKPRFSIQIVRQGDLAGKGGNRRGDNSNSQYAALGLRACLEANVLPPKETLVLAKTWWEKCQGRDGGWCYGEAGGTYGSMTAGALGSLILYKTVLKEPWQAEERVAKGLQWMADNFSVEENPKRERHYFYYMYAMERLGIFSARATFGTHDWYREGATRLLATQQPEGNWTTPGPGGSRTSDVDTCFAILFLRRATPPLQDVASTDRFNKR